MTVLALVKAQGEPNERTFKTATGPLVVPLAPFSKTQYDFQMILIVQQLLDVWERFLLFLFLETVLLFQMIGCCPPATHLKLFCAG